jgi:hypothetical protein
MDCRTVRTLLPYAALPHELGSEERAEFDAHVGSCARCAAIVSAERSFDEAIASAIRDLPTPAGLKNQISARLAIQQGHVFRRQMLKATAAAAALLIVTLTLGWWASLKSEVSADDLARLKDGELQFVVDFRSDDIEGYFRQQGLRVQLYPDFDPAYLVNFDIVEFKGHRAARLDYQHNDARARVYVLSKRQFRMNKEGGSAVSGSNCSVEIVDMPNLIYVIVYQFDAKRENFLNRNQQVG